MPNLIIKTLYEFLSEKGEVILREWTTTVPLGFLCFLLGVIIMFLWNKQRMAILTAQTNFAEKQLLEKTELVQSYESELKQLKEKNDNFQAREQTLNLKEFSLDLVNKLKQFHKEIQEEENLLSLNKKNQSEDEYFSSLYSFRHRKSKEYRHSLKYEVRKVRCFLLKQSNKITQIEDCKDSLEQEILDTNDDLTKICAIKTEIEILARCL
ncbi:MULTISPECIES: hypothetical protein [unclassified Nodularia (in: cyanobacteria)]|uniref:hypothetical protein n=1 Tax=unclassified Nodularia (in: cyanobacteria) TaxID=2656917 RepID=UPI001881BE79|nr:MULTISPECIES: hypothetical protein [unclassified Nodularia (in: cyanobacteria)]MBE9198663.1 hypothetical protein [Nodularia sp. LEGE 06071]MCC2691767.1 hypothetical protein [Nodularia sp. LEGE 04288]